MEKLERGLSALALALIVLSAISICAVTSAATEKGVWRALLLIYQSIDTDYIDTSNSPRHLTYTMGEEEIQKATWSFQQYVPMVSNLSNGEALVQYDLIQVKRSITSLTLYGTNLYWVSPNDTRQELDQFAPPRTYDSVFVFWPRIDLSTGQEVPSAGWGLGGSSSSWSNGATYATLHNGPAYWWERPTVGEPWLHEWLHGVCAFYAGKGYRMPVGDADGGEKYGYTWSSTSGNLDWYRVLMTGHVLENGVNLGVTADAWRSGSILSTPKVSMPTLSPAGGTYSSTQNVVLSCSTSGATVRYTTDSSEPDSSSAVYSGPLSLSSTITVKAKAFMRGMFDSDTADAVYTIYVPISKVATPTFSPGGGTYSSAQSVVVQCATFGAIIRYTMSGVEPSSSSTVLSGSILVSATTTIKAKAFLSGMADSDTVSATFTIKTDTIFADSLLGNWLVYAVVGAVAAVAIVGGMLYWRKKKRHTRRSFLTSVAWVSMLILGAVR